MTTTAASVRPRRGLHQHRLVELLHRAIHAVQPTHDRCRDHLPEALIDHAALAGFRPGHPGQPGHGLLDENIAQPTQQAGSPGPRHHLHRQNAVPAQIEEGVVDPDALQPEYPGVDTGQDLLDRAGRGAVAIDILIFRCRQGALVEFAVDRQRQRRHHHHRGRDHVRRAAARPARYAPSAGSAVPVT